MRPLTLLLGALALAPACGSPDDPGVDPIVGPAADPRRACADQALPRLSVSGNRLVARCGDLRVPVRLKGLNRSGLQHKSGLAAAGFDPDPSDELRVYRDAWGATAVRLPFGQTDYLRTAAYRADLDRVVAAARALGIYLILELHGYDAEHLNPPQPDPGTTPDLWAQIARRYGGEPHVLFDLWNEPHDVPWATWKGNAEAILRAVRGAGAGDTLLVIGGLDYAYDLSPLLDPLNRIIDGGPVVYATHPYPRKSDPPAMAPQWDQAFGRAAQQLPVLVGEYGVDPGADSPAGLGSPEAARAWLGQLHAYVDQRGLSALAWSAGDLPHLTLGRDGRGVVLPGNPPDPSRPTDPFGRVVQAWMQKGP